MKILMVDSNVEKNIEKKIKKISDKISLNFCRDSKSAIEIASKNKFDVIILNLEIFDKNLKAIEAIGERRKVIILANSDELSVREKLISIEINLIDYIIKSDISFASYLIKVISRLIRNDFIKLLFVGKDMVLRNKIEKILNLHNYHFIFTSTHVEAVELLEHNRVDLILCDYDILDEEGVFFVQVIREKSSMSKLPIVIMSNFNKDINIERYLKAGANDYIHKPFSREGLLCRLNLNIENKLLAKKNTECFLKDDYTGLYSFDFFQESGKKMLNGAKREDMPLAIGIIEIDDFHHILDTINYKSNEIIRHLANIVISSLRTSDLVGKYTDEKIVILMANTPLENAFRVIDRIRQNIKALPYILNNRDEINYTISGGVAGKGNGDLNAMIDQADEKLYRAKKYGMDRVEMLLEDKK